MKKDNKSDVHSGSESSYETIKIHAGGTVSVSDAAKIFRCSIRTIRNWMDKGLPVAAPAEGKGSVTRLSLDDILRFRSEAEKTQEYDDEGGETYNLEREKARRQFMLADLEEMRRDREAGKIVLIEDVIKVVEDEYAMVRSGVLGLPARLVMRLTTMDDSREIYEYIRSECGQVLTDLSTGFDVAKNSVQYVTDDDATVDDEEEEAVKDGQREE